MLIKPVILFRNKSAKIYVRNFKVFVTEIVFLLFLLFCRNKSNEVEYLHFVLFVYFSIRSICPFIYLSFAGKFASTWIFESVFKYLLSAKQFMQISFLGKPSWAYWENYFKIFFLGNICMPIFFVKLNYCLWNKVQLSNITQLINYYMLKTKLLFVK